MAVYKRSIVLSSGLPLLIGCEIQGLLHDLPWPFRTRTYYIDLIFFKLFCILIQQWALQDLLFRQSQTFKHCYIEDIMSGCDKQLILNIFCSWRWKFCLFQDFQGPQPKFKNFPGAGPWIFFCQFQNFPGFSRTVATLCVASVCFHECNV